MAYNHGKERKIWLIKKEQEEIMLRQEKVSEEKISLLRQYDENDFNSDRRYAENKKELNESFFNNIPSYDKESMDSIEQVLDQLHNEDLYLALKASDKSLLEIIFLKMKGYETKEIALILGVSRNQIYKKIDRFRKKFK